MSTWNEEEDGAGWGRLVPSRAERENDRSRDEQAGVEAEMLTALRMVIREFADFEMCGSERRAMDAAVKAVRRALGSAA